MGFLNKGINYEVSKSRCKLADKFKEILNINSIDNISSNFLDVNPEFFLADLVIGVDIVFQIVSPLFDSAESDAVDWIYKCLKPNGVLFLELIDYSERKQRISKNSGVIREWFEFPAGDPYQYLLSKYTLDHDENIVVEKVFIKRNVEKKEHEKNVIVVKSYTRSEIKKILENKGFCVEIYEMDKSDDDDDLPYRVLARKL